MKKISLFFAVTCLLALVSCSKETDIYNAEAVNDAAVKANVEKVFGITFDPNHDWKTITSGELTIITDATVQKVQLLVKVKDIYEDAPSYVTTYTMKKLNEAVVNGQGSIKMSYDAPKENMGLYVAFITTEGNVFKKVEGNTVSIADATQARATRALSTGYTLPLGEFRIAEAIESYANQREWVNGEMLYGLSDADYDRLKMSSPDYTQSFKETFRSYVFSYFKNGRNYNNLPKVQDSGIYNAKVYPITTGDEPIIVTPAYKCDNPAKWKIYEVWESDLYYYYYKDSDIPGTTKKDTVDFFNSLPKYKALPFNKAFVDKNEDDVIGKHGSFALLYFGDSKTPEIGTVGTFQFPKGYKIGFMIRANTPDLGGKMQGELYGDGRLNANINQDTHYNFSSSQLGEEDPRATWLNVNKKMMLTWESGTDADFNDIILDVEGGIEGILPPPVFEPNVFTYCFEDTDQGDYDMNDVVIKAYRINETTIEYNIMACGAYDALYIKNLQYDRTSDSRDLDNTEVHTLFGYEEGDTKHFINTTGIDFEPVIFTRTVSKEFKLATEPKSTQPYIHNASTGKDVHLAEEGDAPHGIMVAYDFCYPRERVCIKDAFPLFNNWGTNPINSTWWYMYPDQQYIIKNVIMRD